MVSSLVLSVGSSVELCSITIERLAAGNDIASTIAIIIALLKHLNINSNTNIIAFRITIYGKANVIGESIFGWINGNANINANIDVVTTDAILINIFIIVNCIIYPFSSK